MLSSKKVINKKKSLPTKNITVKKPVQVKKTQQRKTSSVGLMPVIQSNTTVRTVLNPAAAWPFPTGSRP
ncbi:hypothetical protein [Candidatus Vallotia lariciata]|uniref:hypothetical protein n=1 Tax=Candidatus Vallotia laricis TaxID=2018052 RepID=UPI001D014FD0|nr:hypothetical protein [Candidatus Vallotia lariciata]UDG82817.1 hypothetical protein GKR41_00162 [Candidatus Vallotia lariciata]